MGWDRTEFGRGCMGRDGTEGRWGGMGQELFKLGGGWGVESGRGGRVMGYNLGNGMGQELQTLRRGGGWGQELRDGVEGRWGRMGQELGGLA